jgi:hypothetical protein
MNTAREECIDMLIDLLKDPLLIFVIEKLTASDLKITIGQIANRVLKRELPKLKDQYPKEKLAEMVNLHVKTLEKKINALEQKGQNPSSALL